MDTVKLTVCLCETKQIGLDSFKSRVTFVYRQNVNS